MSFIKRIFRNQKLKKESKKSHKIFLYVKNSYGDCIGSDPHTCDYHYEEYRCKNCEEFYISDLDSALSHSSHEEHKHGKWKPVSDKWKSLSKKHKFWSNYHTSHGQTKTD